MLVNTQQIQIGVTNYIENEIAKKAQGFNKFASYLAIPIANKKVEKLLNSFSENDLLKDMFDEDKKIDIDVIYGMAKTAIQKSGQFVYYGIIFCETDIDKLYTYIRSTGETI